MLAGKEDHRMTEFKKTWRVAPSGALLGSIDIISPWTGGKTEAVVNMETCMVIAAHGATCPAFSLAMVPICGYPGTQADE